MSTESRGLFELLPAIHRIRDAEIAARSGLQAGPLEELIAVIDSQVALLEENIEQSYDDLFIETCADWVTPYIGDVIGYQALHGNVPDVASPAIEACSPSKSHGAYHIRASETRSGACKMMNMVEPYISIMSPFRVTPTESASAAASMVPAVTGVPAFSPVSTAASLVTAPAISPDQSSLGNLSRGTMSPASSSLQHCFSTS